MKRIAGATISKKTQNYYMIALRMFLKYLARIDIKSLPADKIELAKIPERGYDAQGRPYALNKYSKDGEAAFLKAIAEGYDPRIIALAIKMYYSSSVSFKKTVTNYMASGEWQSDYDTILRKSQDGTLSEHLKKELANEYSAPFTRG